MYNTNATATIFQLIYGKLADTDLRLAQEFGQAFNQLMDEYNQRLDLSSEVINRLVKELMVRKTEGSVPSPPAHSSVLSRFHQPARYLEFFSR